MSTTRRIPFAVLSLAILGATSAAATTHTFTAQIDQVIDTTPSQLWAGTFVVGHTISGTITWDPDTPDTTGSSTTGTYLHVPPSAPNGIEVLAAGVTLVPRTSASFEVTVNDIPASDSVQAIGPGDWDSAIPGGATVTLILGGDGTPLSSDALPDELVLADFPTQQTLVLDGAGLGGECVGLGGICVVSATLTSLALQQTVPAVSTSRFWIAAAAIGLAAAWSLRAAPRRTARGSRASRQT